MSEVKKLAEQAKRYGSLTVTLDVDDVLALQQKLDALAAKPETTSTLKVELPEVEKWRSMDQVRAQMAYRVLVEKALKAGGFEVKS